MGATIEYVAAQVDLIVKGMDKLNHIVIGNGDPGLCEQVRDMDKRLDDIDIAIGQANNHALAAKEAAESVKNIAKGLPSAVGAAPNPQNITVNANQGFDWLTFAKFLKDNWHIIFLYTNVVIGYVWVFLEKFIFHHLK